MTTREHKNPATTQPADGDAVLYLRVSSEGQVNTDYNPEGISLPAQRKAAHERATEIGAPVITEFIDPGKTAKSIEHRQAFRDMITYLRGNPNVRYVVVYALSRFARNRYDDAIMMATLEKLGVHLVSATERNLDDTPAGRAMHGILAVFNEYQVLVSGEDIKYKMGQKARSGGTLGIAKLGYQNIRITHDGREIRTVTLDPERAPYVTMAFDAGLRTKGNRRYGPRPISIHTIGNLLRDRYYLGYVTYEDVEYPGRHEPLITPDLFERVQKVLYTDRGAGTRQRVHDHYLKGTLWCARCKRRLILRPSTSKTGNIYFYFICRGNQAHDCDLPSLPVAKVEKAVTNHYTQVTIPTEHRTTLETLATDACTDSQQTMKRLRGNLRRQLAELDRQEDRYLDLLGDPDWPEDKLKARMRDIRTTKQRITRELDETTDTLDAGRAVLAAALELLDRPRDLYNTATEHARKLLNKAIFTRLYLDTGPAHPTVTTDELHEPFSSLIHAIRTTGTDQPPPSPRNTKQGREDDDQSRLASLLATAL
ncbi:MAG: recombinase family protein, partial [Actinobacteria bacterium]|nr:recombinase family protein [Actinomycetota bacterium]